MVENWAESATTVKPQIRPTIRTPTVGSPNNNPSDSAQAAEIDIIRIVVFVRPQRSPRIPPIQQPIPPIPITAKVANAAAEPDGSPRSASAAPKKTTNQA